MLATVPVLRSYYRNLHLHGFQDYNVVSGFGSLSTVAAIFQNFPGTEAATLMSLLRLLLELPLVLRAALGAAA